LYKVLLRTLWVGLLAAVMLVGVFQPGAAQEPIVRAVLFYSPTCPHCHTVITEVLPPLFEQYGGEVVTYITPLEEGREDYGPPLVAMYGDSLEILYVNTATSLGSNLYGTMARTFELLPEQQGVPALVVGETLMIGGFDIPERFPSLIASGLANNGYDWPDLEGLSSAMLGLVPAEGVTQDPEGPNPEATESASDPSQEAGESEPSPTTASPFVETELTVMQRIQQDPLGNSISIAVLIGMLVVLAAVIVRSQVRGKPLKRTLPWVFPLLIVVGIVVASYLAYIESTGAVAVCGPVGDCNTVNQSEYARIFGIPIAVLGLFGYFGIAVSWLTVRFGKEPWVSRAKVLLMAFTSFGTTFSIYLTFLEPFVIGATCAWCLTSAVVMTLLFWFSAEPGFAAWERMLK